MHFHLQLLALLGTCFGIALSLPACAQEQNQTCLIQFHPKLIVANRFAEQNLQDLHTLIEQENCPETIDRQMQAHPNILNNTTLGTKEKILLLITAINQESGTQILHNANEIQIINLENELNKRLNDTSDPQFQVSDVQLLAPRQYLLLSGQENYQIAPLRESQTSKITVSRTTGEQVFWFSSKVKRKTVVLKAMSNIPMSSQMDLTHHFTLTESYEEYPERYFSQLDLLPYFNLTRHIEQGHLLLVNDLTSKLLIQNNQMIKVEINLNNLKITTTAIAKQSGKRGDFITLSTLDGKKKIIGKIIDFNQVQVQL